ncbi:MAG: cobyrinate a,c-diamide synthase [Peptococcaceae bacterium]|jgi:cobyrinic acid a,c-diamide synthase|nr:cobyrinate a,c-diamide synthase [Peptococcaceae bacterium]MDH7525797.1 cobyrinate a,c-diamide synthase [Peptococcaceae bacterium]
MLEVTGLDRKTGYPRLVVAGTQSGVGKTTVSLGLMAALSGRMKVQPYKVGPDYIDTAYHTFITGRKSRNLDGWMLDEEVLAYLFRKNMAGAGIAVIEGVMGLYDGAEAGGGRGSTAQVARLLRAPVVLVVDGSGMAASSAALVRGYRDFDHSLSLAGVIFNRLGGEGHYRLLKEAVEESAGVKVFGYLPQEAEVALPDRHLGLVPSAEVPSLREKIARLAALVEKTVEVDELARLAGGWPLEAPGGSFEAGTPVGREIPVGVALDEAFNFYYWDNLDLLEELGARLEYFSPLHGERFPDGVGGLILGGGFPEVFAPGLEKNEGMRESLKAALSRGLPYLAECGGLMYLLESLVDFTGGEYQMVGWLQGKCRMTSRLQRFGYAELMLQKSCLLGAKGQGIRVHEFHHSAVEGVQAPAAYRLSKKRSGKVVQEWECGYLKGNGVAGYPHLHFYGNASFARKFMAAARDYFNSETTSWRIL